MTAAAVVERLRVAFGPAADSQRAAGAAAYMRNQFVFLGIPTPERRRLQRAALGDLAPPTERQLKQITLALWRKREREFQYAACDYLRTHVGVASAGFIDVAAHLVTTKAWWDTVDTLAAHSVGPLVRRHPELVATMDEWAVSNDIWLARTALLHQLAYKNSTDEERLFRYCSLRATDREFFIRKAIGWALREHAARRADAVDEFLVRTPELSALSIREARKGIIGACAGG